MWTAKAPAKIEIPAKTPHKIRPRQIQALYYLKNRNKFKWAIGRDYEMYVDYLYE